MKSILMPTLLLVVSLTLIPYVFASSDPIPGVDVVVEKIPPGHSIGRVTTDSKGVIALKGDFERGYYEVRNRDNTIRAGIEHQGGQIRWQLLKSGDSKKPWKLVTSR